MVHEKLQTEEVLTVYGCHKYSIHSGEAQQIQIRNHVQSRSLNTYVCTYV